MTTKSSADHLVQKDTYFVRTVISSIMNAMYVDPLAQLQYDYAMFKQGLNPMIPTTSPPPPVTTPMEAQPAGVLQPLQEDADWPPALIIPYDKIVPCLWTGGILFGLWVLIETLGLLGLCLICIGICIYGFSQYAHGLAQTAVFNEKQKLKEKGMLIPEPLKTQAYTIQPV
jgi:hypothetical protein